jgi:hypothetical protein
MEEKQEAKKTEHTKKSHQSKKKSLSKDITSLQKQTNLLK